MTSTLPVRGGELRGDDGDERKSTREWHAARPLQCNPAINHVSRSPRLARRSRGRCQDHMLSLVPSKRTRCGLTQMPAFILPSSTQRSNICFVSRRRLHSVCVLTACQGALCSFMHASFALVLSASLRIAAPGPIGAVIPVFVPFSTPSVLAVKAAKGHRSM